MAAMFAWDQSTTTTLKSPFFSVQGSSRLFAITKSWTHKEVSNAAVE
jgi:hypothetical protein